MKLNFEHHQTAHCENGVASNLLRYKGIKLSEPMIFGIGSGLFFVYLPFLKVNFAPGFSYRPMPGAIFSKAAKRLGIKIKRQKFSNPRDAQAALEKNLENNIPTGLQVGVFNLTYFPEEYKFHFNAHNLVVYGKEEGRFLISDPVMDYVTSLSEAELEKVRYAKGALPPKGHMYFPVYIPENINVEEAIKKGIKDTCKNMLAPVPLIGIKAMRWVARSIPKWAEKKGTKVTNHYLGQLIRMQEEIGTGGGGFRFIYGAFLQEAADILKNDQLRELSKEITAIGDLWRDFAVDIARVYKNRNSKSNIYQELSKSMLHIADLEEAFLQKTEKSDLAMAEHIIEIKNLYKKYKNSDEFSVNDISLNISKNEIYGILGPNGAGKTTLISMLSGLIKPSSGHFTINGLSPKKDSSKIKQIIGIVPQEYALYPTLTAKENLLFFGSLYGLKHKTLHKSIDESLERMGLSKFADKKVEQFSGGMKRRCNLIAGTLHNPKVLFLDEPTVGVDVQSKKVIIDFLQELNKNGTCIIYTSHHLSEAEEFCTKIAIIDKGRIHAVGSPEELVTQIATAENLEDVFISLTGKELRDVVV